MTLRLLFMFEKRQFCSVMKRALAFIFSQHILYLLDSCSLNIIQFLACPGNQRILNFPDKVFSTHKVHIEIRKCH